MYKQWQEELKKKAPKTEDIVKVENYLHDNFNRFYDEMMVQLHQQQEKQICLEMGEVLSTYGIIVNDEKILKWAKMCMALENIPIDICQDIALRAKLHRLQAEVVNLKFKIAKLKGIDKKVKELLEIYEKED